MQAIDGGLVTGCVLVLRGGDLVGEGDEVAAGGHGVRTSDAPIIQMDPLQSSILEVRSPTGFRSSVLELPSERVLESPSVTMRIQRSILLPPTRRWWPFNRNKKVVVGELLSRVDPQAPHVQIGSGFSVWVKATVGRDGHVERVEPVNGPATLAPTVVSAIREWRYQPTLADDRPVETECYIEVHFHAPARTAKQFWNGSNEKEIDEATPLSGVIYPSKTTVCTRKGNEAMVFVLNTDQGSPTPVLIDPLPSGGNVSGATPV